MIESSTTAPPTSHAGASVDDPCQSPRQHNDGRAPSAAQWRVFEQQHPHDPVCLVYLLRGDTVATCAESSQLLCNAALAAGGAITWSGRVCAPLNPLPFPWHYAVVLHFADTVTYRAFAVSPGHRRLVGSLADLEVHSLRTRASSRHLIALLQWILPWFAPAEAFSDRDITEESICDIDADATRLRELAADTSTQPICILNFHRYRKRSLYRKDEAEYGEDASGLKAYMRYGRAALRTVLGRGNRLLVIGHYGQCLIGNNGDPAHSQFNEVTLMQYHSRRELINSFRMKSMDGRLRHRRAGLEYAVMVIVEPDPDFVASARLP